MNGQAVSSIRRGHELDLDALGDALARHMGSSIALPVEVQQFCFGHSNPTYLLTDREGARFVLRKQPAGALLSSTAHNMSREFSVLKALDGHFPVPAAHFYSETPLTPRAGSYFVMSFVSGRIFHDLTFPGTTRAQRVELWEEAVRVLAKLHSLSPRLMADGGSDIPSDYYGRQIRTLEKVSKRQGMVTKPDGTLVGDIPRLGELVAWFSQNKPQDRVAIVHGDFKLDNVIFDDRESRIIGVLDWEMSTIGHPLADLANLLMPFYMPVGAQAVVYAGVREPDVENLIRLYSKQVDIAYPVPGWRFCIAFVLFKFAVISQGIDARIALGNASSAKAARAGSAWKALSALAWQRIRQSHL